MKHDQIWNCDEPVTDLLGISIPQWIDQEITANTVIAITHGGCSSGAYMPAATHANAKATMADHGDDVLEYIEGNYGELPSPKKGESWSGIAVFYLSIAVELWAGSILCDLENMDREGE